MSHRQAIISVSDSTNISHFAQHLIRQNYTLIATGGTYDKLVNVVPSNRLLSVTEYTGSPEKLDGRVKTLNETLHAGILARSDQLDQLINLDIKPIDMIVCNLYPFAETVAHRDCILADAIEQIDIGGVTMLRAGAKNYERVTVVSDPNDYQDVITYMDQGSGVVPLEYRKKLAVKTFKTTFGYDASVASYLSDGQIQGRTYEKVNALKYGCNPHQGNAAVWTIAGKGTPAVRVLHGNPSYINYLDAFNGWQLVQELRLQTGYPACASFKHTSPAGAAIASVELSDAEKVAYQINPDINLGPQALAFVRARNGDPKSSFGDFIAVSDQIDVQTAKLIAREISDGIIAPGFDPKALEILKNKKNGNYVILQSNESTATAENVEFREMFGMALSQQPNQQETMELINNNTFIGSNSKHLDKLDLVVANVAQKYAQSNSVAIATRGQIIGLGAGQQNRVDCVKLAGHKADVWHWRLLLKDGAGATRQDRVNSTIAYIEKYLCSQNVPRSGESIVLASDGFFPFTDNIQVAKKYGVTHIIQPGGSTADTRILEECEKSNIKMMMTGKRFFYH